MSEKQNGSIEPWLLYKTAKETPDRTSPAFPDQMCLKKFFTKAEMTGKAFFRHISKGEKNMRKERWVVSAKRADFQAIADRYGIDPVIARLIRNRDVTGEKEIEEYLFGDLEQLHDPFFMKDMESISPYFPRRSGF